MGNTDFVLEGKDYAIPLNILGMCISAFQSIELPYNMWIIGDVFLRKFYSIYDHGNERVGLALAV